MGEGLKKGIVIAGMLTFGTFTVVIQKIIFNLKGYGKDRTTKHYFEKPWFQTEAMFIGMFGCLVVYEVMRCIQKRKARDPARAALLSDEKPQVNAQEPNKDTTMPKWKQYCIVCTPALCDMVATAMMNIGLLWIAPSVWQMLRGSMVIFSALFSKFFLKRELHASHWIGVSTVAFALVVVAFAALSSSSQQKTEAVSSSYSSSSAAEVTTAQVALGCSLVVVAQVIQASQIVVEEFLLKEISLHAVLIVGLEGMWGTIVCSVLLCFTGFIPDGYGGEDTIDTLIMFFTNGKILATGLVYAACILCYNLFGMFVTQYTSAVLRTILEGLRCACIWLTNLVIHYGIMRDDKRFGEVWNNWSYLQLCGFLFLLLGMFLYNGIVRIDGLYYADKDPSKNPKLQATPTVVEVSSEQTP